MLDLFVKMTQLGDVAMADEVAPPGIGSRIAYVLFITLGLGLGSLVGLFLLVVSGLLPIAC